MKVDFYAMVLFIAFILVPMLIIGLMGQQFYSFFTTLRMNDSGNAWVIYSLAKLQRSIYWNQLNNVRKKFGYYILTLSVVDFLVRLI